MQVGCVGCCMWACVLGNGRVAVHKRQEVIVKQLLAAGAEPSIGGRRGGCPLLEAAMGGSTAIQVGTGLQRATHACGVVYGMCLYKK
jgi:hypothetical protein